MNKIKYLSAFVGALLIAQPAFAQTTNWPARTVRIIVPYAAGGNTDFTARSMAVKLTEMWGQQIIVDNRPGGATNIGSEVAAKAVPDGYTLFMGGASNAVNMSLFAKPPYDTLRDFAPIVLCVQGANLFAVHPSVPAKNLKELIALAKRQPGKLNFASSGIGSSNQMAGELLKVTAGINIVHIPYKGATPALTDVIAGQASLYFTSPIAAQPYVQSGRLRQLAVTSAQRFPPLPDVPTVAESGLRDYEIVSWWGLLAPAGVPREIIARVHAEAVKALNTAEMKERLAGQSAMVVTNTPEQFAAYIKSEIANWGRIVAVSGARMD